MNIPILLALLALVTGGVVRFSWKFAAANQAYGPSFMLAQEIGIFIVLIGAHFVQRHPFDLSSKMTGVAILAGIIGAVGILGLYFGLSLGGQGSILLPISALTMLVAVPLMFIVYREPVTATKLLGLGLGVSSIIVLTR